MFKEINSEVAFFRNQNRPNFDTKSISELRAKFQQSPRQRYRLCFQNRYCCWREL